MRPSFTLYDNLLNYQRFLALFSTREASPIGCDRMGKPKVLITRTFLETTLGEFEDEFELAEILYQDPDFELRRYQSLDS